jgi:hypothetical protein
VRRFASGVSEQNNQDDFSDSRGYDFDHIIINVSNLKVIKALTPLGFKASPVSIERRMTEELFGQTGAGLPARFPGLDCSNFDWIRHHPGIYGDSANFNRKYPLVVVPS